MHDIIIPTCKTEQEISALLEAIKLTATGNYNLIVMSGPNRSAAQNRNAGLDRAPSKAVIMIDDDIRNMPEGWNEKLLAYLGPDVAIVSARLMKVTGEPGPMVGSNYSLDPETVEAEELPTACIAFRKTELRFDENFKGSGFEDNDFCRQMSGTFIIANRVKVTHINEAKNQGGDNWLFNEAYYKAKWMEVYALYKTFDGEEFVEASLRSIYPHVTKIVMVHSDVNWLGQRELNRVRPVVQRFIDGGGDPEGKIVQVNHDTPSQSEQYRFGFDFIHSMSPSEKPWFILIIDCDEIWEERDIKRLKFEVVKDKVNNVFTCSLHTYVKQLFYRVDPPEMLHPIVMIAGHKIKSMEGVRAGKLDPFNRRDLPDVFMHHFTYVRKDLETIRRKFLQTKQAELKPPMREDWLETVWPMIPDAVNFHPTKGYEHSWKRIKVVEKKDLPEAVREMEDLRVKEHIVWKERVKTIHPDDCIEVPIVEVFAKNAERFAQEGFTDEVFQQILPICEQSVWSTFQLFCLARQFKAGGRILEIGSGQGGSLVTMGLAVERNPGVELISIDRFQPYDEKTHGGWMFNVDRFSYKKFVTNLEARGVKARNIYKWSFEAVDDIENGSCDLVFVDGNHSYQCVKDDNHWYLPKVKQGGILCGHDFHPRFPGVIQAVEEAFGNDFDVMDYSSIWVKLIQ